MEDDISRLGDDSESDRDLSDLENDLLEPSHAAWPVLSHPPLAFVPQPFLLPTPQYTHQLALCAGFSAVTARSCPVNGQCLVTCVTRRLGGQS